MTDAGKKAILDEVASIIACIGASHGKVKAESNAALPLLIDFGIGSLEVEAFGQGCDRRHRVTAGSDSSRRCLNVDVHVKTPVLGAQLISL
jgi:hypothetical protein